MNCYRNCFFLILNLICLFIFPVSGQDLDSLKKSDYTNQQKLLIKSEVRKRLGDKANSPDVRELTSDLIPWAMMEGIEATEFARYIFLFSKAKEVGIPFSTLEDLIPILPKFKGDESDFLLLALSISESVKSELPLHLRDPYLNSVILKKWDGLSTITGLRVLILSRAEQINSEEITNKILKSVPGNLRSQNSEKVKTVFNELTATFVSKKAGVTKNKIISDLLLLHSGRITESLRNQINITQKNLGNDFSEFGVLELKERPKLEWTIEDLQGTNQTEQTPTDWRFLSGKNLEEVVKGWIGTRYVYGGSSKTGTDCSGFTRGVLTDKLIAVPTSLIPRSARDQAKIGNNALRTQLLAGDLVFFSASPNQSKITHVGMSLGADRFAHASSSRGVVIQSLNEKWWTGRFTNARRIFVKVGK